MADDIDRFTALPGITKYHYYMMAKYFNKFMRSFHLSFLLLMERTVRNVVQPFGSPAKVRRLLMPLPTSNSNGLIGWISFYLCVLFNWGLTMTLWNLPRRNGILCWLHAKEALGVLAIYTDRSLTNNILPLEYITYLVLLTARQIVLSLSTIAFSFHFEDFSGNACLCTNNDLWIIGFKQRQFAISLANHDCGVVLSVDQLVITERSWKIVLRVYKAEFWPGKPTIFTF